MRNLFQILFLALVFTTAWTSCKKDQSVEVVETEDVQTPAEVEAEDVDANYVITKGVIHWLGDKKIGGSHDGTIRVKSGNVVVSDGEVASGNFEIDMNSIESVDLKDSPDKKMKLEGHLKSDDFFAVSDNPLATFQITEVDAVSGREDATHMISGNLTMRGIPHGITIPATIDVSGDKFMAKTPTFFIDRTNWGVNFKSSVLKVAQDEMINDKVALRLEIEGMKR